MRAYGGYLGGAEHVWRQQREGQVGLNGARVVGALRHLEEDAVRGVPARTHLLEAQHQRVLRPDGRDVLGLQQCVHSGEPTPKDQRKVARNVVYIICFRSLTSPEIWLALPLLSYKAERKLVSFSH